MKIGIIAAEQEEFEAILNIAKVEERKEIYELNFVKCKIKDKICVLVKSGVGKVNAARATQILIDNFKPDYIVNVGVAGGLNPMLSIGDIVIGETLVQHDFDITAFGHSKGYITGVGNGVECNNIIIESIKKAVNSIRDIDFKVKLGTVATGDIFCTDVAMKDKISAKFDADVVDMECGAVAQVAYLSGIPFGAIRGVSDTPNGKNAEDFDKNLDKAADICKKVLEKTIDNL